MRLHLQLIFIIMVKNCVFSLTFDAIKFEDRFYYLDHSRKLTWSAGVSMCMERGLQIVNANTKSVNDFLKKVTHKDKDYWLGIMAFSRVSLNPQHSAGTDDLAWYSPIEELVFQDWCANELEKPNRWVSVLSKDKCWRFVSDNVPSYTICEDKFVKPAGSKDLHGKPFHFYDKKGVSFFDAHKICKNNNHILANIDDEQLSIEMMNEVKKRKTNYWIGLKSFEHYGIPVSKWYWNSTQHALSYKNWCAPQTNKPNLHYKHEWCGYINAGEGCWKTEVCDRDFGNVDGFICEDNSDTIITADDNSITTATEGTINTDRDPNPNKTTDKSKFPQGTTNADKDPNHGKTPKTPDNSKFPQSTIKPDRDPHHDKTTDNSKLPQGTIKPDKDSHHDKTTDNSKLPQGTIKPDKDSHHDKTTDNSKLHQGTIKPDKDSHHDKTTDNSKLPQGTIKPDEDSHHDKTTDNSKLPQGTIKPDKDSHHDKTTDNSKLPQGTIKPDRDPNHDKTTDNSKLPQGTIKPDHITTTDSSRHPKPTTGAGSKRDPNLTTTTSSSRDPNHKVTTVSGKDPKLTTAKSSSKVPQPTTISVQSADSSINYSRYRQVKFNGIYYFFYDGTVSRAEANAICRKNKHNLVTIDDAHLSSFLKSEMEKRARSYWIGTEAYTMKYPQKEILYWRWNNTGIDIEYESWCPNEIKSKDRPCAYGKATDKNACWMFSNCERTNDVTSFICEAKMNHTIDYDVVIYKKHEYFVFNKNRKKRSWYDARDECAKHNKHMLTLDSNAKIDFFNRIFLTKNMSAWVGLETYVQLINTKKYVYWRWQGTLSDISYKNWCPHSEVEKEAMCGYVTLDPVCWLAEKCTLKDPMSFVCEDKLSSVQGAHAPFQHFSALPYHQGG